MYLASLYFSGFRNLATQSIELDPNLNFIIGRNAQGKTNLLESFYYLSQAKSFRTNKTKDLANWEGKEACIRGVVNTALTDHEIEIIIRDGKREILLDKKKLASVADLLGVFQTVCFVPDDLNLIKSGPELRRKFMNRHLVDLNPELLTPLVNYNRALKSKNLLLKDQHVEYEKIHPWNRIMSDLAALIYREKYIFLEKLLKKSNEVMNYFADTDGEVYLSLKSNLDKQRNQNPQEILAALEAKFPDEQRYGRSLLGLHLDDLKIELGEKSARSFASQGQTRSLALALKLAIVELIGEEKGDLPVILLDDLDSELDRERANKLFRFLFDRQCQIIVTGTELRDPERSSHDENKVRSRKIFSISAGKIASI